MSMLGWKQKPGRGHLLGTPAEYLYTRYSPTYYRSRRHAAALREEFDAVSRFCLFVGHPRSGHTLVAALLNAHPDMVVANELDVLQFVAAGYGRDQLYWLILQRDGDFMRAGASWAGYRYGVPGQWQGRRERLVVIGDKHGGDTVARLRHRPELLGRLEETVGVPVRMIHVVRDPRDNIPTLMRRGGRTLTEAIRFYFTYCETLAALHAEHGDAIRVSRLERFVAEPAAELSELSRHLGVAPSEEYLDACVEIVFNRPSRTRDTIDWPATAEAEVRARSADYPWLAPYAG